MIELHSITSDYSGTKGIFEIKLDKEKVVYMSIAKTNFNNDERCVVVVDATKFLKLWKAEPYSIHSDISMGNPETWKNDRKYHHAVKGFSFGISNPVPLANVVCNEHVISKPIYERKYILFKKLLRIEEIGINYVSYINGITRTIWLLCNGAKSFPIECNLKDGAQRLAEYAGYGKNSFCTVEQLTNGT
ncbi:plasmid fertility inhibition factor family protein [Candidatus Thiodiazotropha sp. LNASS1]|uniref:plasmid fertility inhibition factor family protein n=1 Tax=Candidatus Thiodiazotropha sp. LNASS1 TaxID=3096260 RepID=UPI0034DEA1A7